MLTSKLVLHDLGDTESFCSAALDQQLKRFNSRLGREDREDALAFAISETWRLSHRFDPHRSHSFAAYARPFQARFLIEFYRRRFIDTRNEHRYSTDEWARILELTQGGVASLDAPAHSGDGTSGTVGDLVAGPPDGRDGDSAPDGLRLLPRGDSELVEAARVLRDHMLSRRTSRAA